MFSSYSDELSQHTKHSAQCHFGRIGRNGSIRPFEKLRVEQLKTELRSRGIEPVGLKKDLKVELREILGSVQRVPALLINNHRTPIADTNLHSYEVLPGESLHDVKGHIKNLLDELKFHLEDDVRKHYEDAYEAAIGDKDALRGSDLRLGLILMTVSLQDKISERVLELLESLAEISHLLYLLA